MGRLDLNNRNYLSFPFVFMCLYPPFLYGNISRFLHNINHDEKLLTIIVLSFNDLRIFRAINSIISHPSASQILIHVQDAGSRPELIHHVKLIASGGYPFIRT